MTSVMNPKPPKLRKLTDEEFTEAQALARQSGTPLSQCPTCRAKPTEIPGSDGVKELIPGTYTLDGSTFPCDCQSQIALRTQYLVAHIPAEYMTLDWSEYNRDPEVRKQVAFYLDKWENFLHGGIGMEFASPALGVGKTWSATHIAKEMVKNGQRVFFIPFVDMVSAFQSSRAEAIESRMRETTYLVIDEILSPVSKAQHDFYAFRLEALIRHRSSLNLPTILTTNLTNDELVEYYPRTYSLLSAKQLRVEMGGEDHRKSDAVMRKIERLANGDALPLT